MTPQRSWTAGVGVVLALGACLEASAQEDEALVAVRARLDELMKRDPSAYLCCDVELTVGPFGTLNTTLDVCARDRQHYRAEDTYSSVLVVTPKQMKLYNAPWSTMLHLPAETVPGLEPQQQGPLAFVGFGTPEATFGLLRQFSGELTRSGEGVVGDVPCWVFSAGPKMKETAKDTVSLFCSGPWQVDVTVLDLFLERETALPRGMHLDAALDSPEGLAVSLTLDVMVRELELDVDVTDDILTLTPPAETTDVIEWTPEAPTEDVSAFLIDLVFAVLRGREGDFEP